MDLSFDHIEPPAKAFFPASFLEFEQPPTFPYVLLVLNSPITRGKLYEQCASRAMAIMAADGGANRIYDYAKKTGVPNLIATLRPETIIGDLDSLRPDTEKYFRDRGTTIVRDDDQYATDFMKALKHIATQASWWLSVFNQRYGRQEQTLKVLTFGGLGGRADQAFSQIHHLYVASQNPLFSQLDLYLVTGDSIMFLLEQGLNLIETPLRLLGENIGIIPIGKPASITTTGFEWDVTNWETSFGTQLSTSNHIRAPQVSVRSTERLIFTVEIPEHEQDTQAQQQPKLDFEADGITPKSDPANPMPSMWSWT